MPIRPEAPQDLPALERLHIEAFADHPHSRQTEHLIVNELRRTGGLALSLVAEEAGQVLGHVAFSPARIDGADLGWFTLGPVAVGPAHQNRGIGSRLIRQGLEAIRRGGARGCLLVGEPGYYARFGFQPAPSLQVPGIPPAYVLALPFAGDVPTGCVAHHPAFGVTA